MRAGAAANSALPLAPVACLTADDQARPGRPRPKARAAAGLPPSRQRSRVLRSPARAVPRTTRHQCFASSSTARLPRTASQNASPPPTPIAREPLRNGAERQHMQELRVEQRAARSDRTAPAPATAWRSRKLRASSSRLACGATGSEVPISADIARHAPAPRFPPRAKPGDGQRAVALGQRLAVGADQQIVMTEGGRCRTQRLEHLDLRRRYS